MNIEVFKFDPEKDVVHEWVTQFAAVSRGKDKANYPEKRFEALLKEGAGNRPSRPVEYYPVKLVKPASMIDDEHFELMRYGHVKNGHLHTNLRAVMIANVPESEYIVSDAPYYVFRVTLPKHMWATVVIKSIATIVSVSARVVDVSSDSLCEEEVTMTIGGYAEDIAFQADIIQKMVSMDRSNSTIELIALVNKMLSIKEVKEAHEVFVGSTYISTGPFKCITDYLVYKPTQSFGNVSFYNDKYNANLNYNEYRWDRNISALDMQTGYNNLNFIEIDAPLFVIYHLFTHTEVVVDIMEDKNKIWFPSEMEVKDVDYAMSLIRKGEFKKVRMFMKQLGYSKEIYNRYPNFATMHRIEIVWRDGNTYAMEQMLKERNVIDPSNKNWTQKETTELLELIHKELKEQKVME